jgi:hypothetical protein
MSLTKRIKTPEDTGQELFINDLNAFQDWKLTFDHTKQAVDSIIRGTINQYDIIHDATDRSQFKTVISAFLRKTKLVKDSWNPADIFVIKKTDFLRVVTSLQDIVDSYDASTNLIDVFNKKIYYFYQKGIMYPISLKKLTQSRASIEKNNIPGATTAASYDIAINRINCDLSLEGKEIGLMTFTNKDTSKNITMQVRGFPHGYTVAQTEITSDGSPTGGRLGKVSTSIVDRVMSQYNDQRISSITFFGRTTSPFSEFDKDKTDMVWSWYQDVIRNQKVSVPRRLTKKEFEGFVATAKKNFQAAETLAIKIQGLKMIHFFISNESHIADIMNKMIAGAKKQSGDGAFFIKIS